LHIRPGERVKTDRQDSQILATLHRAGELTPVWVPDQVYEAMRDLVRARMDAAMQQMTARQQLLAFLLRHGRIYEKGKHWTQNHLRWLAIQTFEQPAHQIVYQDYVEAVLAARDWHSALLKRIDASRTGLVCGAAYRRIARVARHKMDIIADLPKAVRDIAWKAQLRLCGRFRRMLAKGKKPTVVVTAIAREFAEFVWDVGREVKPELPATS